MSLGTIHPNLYKSDAKEVKSPIRTEDNLNISDRRFVVFIISFLFVSTLLISSALASHSQLLSVSDGSDRINKTGASVIWRFNVSSSLGTITAVNITNATTGTSFYRVTAVESGGTCSILSTHINCTGLSISAGTSLLINVTAVGPAAGQSGRGNWTVNTTDGTDVIIDYVFTLALDNTDIGFDLSDQLGNITLNATIRVANGTNSLLTFNGGAEVQVDTDNDGLIIIESSSLDPGGDDTFSFNVSKNGFVNVTNFNTTVTFLTGGTNNGYKPTGQQFGIRITVEDQLGNALSGATVNVTATNGSTSSQCAICTNTTTTANATLGGNTFFFALSNTSFSNVTFYITRSGFLNNGTLQTANTTSGTFFLANSSSQQNGSSPYQMRFVLRVNATDELGSPNSTRTGTGLTLAMNTTGVGVNTAVTANRTDPTDGNVYFFSINETAFTVMNVTASKPGYVNASVVIPINASTQASINPQMLFRLRVRVQDELGGTTGFTSAVTIRLNGTSVTANATSSNSYFFNTTDSAVNISTSRTGYTNGTNNSIPLNNSVQADLTPRMNFSIKVIGICSEIVAAGQCFTIDGTDSAVEVSGNGNRNSTYSGNVSYINATNGPSATTITLNASKNGYVNRSITIITNDSAQAVVMFNTSGGVAVTDRVDGLLFTVRVLGVFDELGIRNFTLDGTTAAIDVGSGQLNNVFYSGPRAYANATGTSAVDIIAYMVNQSYINETQSVTPSAAYQQTILFNATNQTTGQVNITDRGLNFTIRVNVQDERGQIVNMDSGVAITLNGTDYAADSRVGASYFFTNRTGAVPGGVNISSSRSGYINSTNTSLPINQTLQARLNISLSFTARYAATDELGNNLTASDVTFYANNSNAVGAANFTDSVYAYFAFAPGAIYVNASRAGYVDNGTIYIDPINASAQTVTRNITMNYTIVVISICDEVNATCLTIDGSTAVVNSGGAEISANGVAGRGATNLTRYSGGRAYINATNATNINITAFGDGFINRTVSGATPNAANQTRVVFNTSSLTNSHVNASALLFSLRVLPPCDQLNYTCQSLTGSITTAGQAASDINGTSMTGGNITRYSGGRAYISAGGTGPGRTPIAFTINASSVGFINATNSSVTPSTTAQVDVVFNTTTTALNYAIRMTLQDELSQTAQMNNSVILFTNNSNLVENVSFFRTSPTSNLYYINATNPGSVNVTAGRVGYINTTFGGATGTAVNQTVQATPTIQLPFSVRIETRSADIDSATTARFNGATVQLIDSGNNIYTVKDGNGTVLTLYNNSVSVTNSSAIQGDGNSSSDGFIYWALSQSNVTGSSEVVVYPNRNGYDTWRITGRVLGYTSQLQVTSGNPTSAVPPAAATGASATISGKQVSVTWTGSTAGNVNSYRIYRNDTLLGTVAANTTTFVDSPTLGDSTAPAAPSSVTATQSGTQVSVAWTAPAFFNYIYRITTVSTAGVLAASNASTSAVSINSVASYRVFRNSTLLGSSSATSYTDSPGATGVYIYNVSAISDANVSSTSNGTASSVDTRDTTVPAAPTSPTGTVNGKQVVVAWTASSSSDVSYYRVYRNNTLLGTSSSTSFTDTPTLGDTLAPGAPSSVSATKIGTEVQVSWTAPAYFAYAYNINTVDTAGNAATSNVTANATVNQVARYLVYRNNTLLGTSDTTSFKENPGDPGVYTYSVTTVTDANVSSSSNGTSTVDTRDTTAPAAVPAASFTATTLGSTQVSLSWAASSANDTSYYRVYRNNTFIGTSSNTTGFIDNPILGDATAPGAPSGVTATQTNNAITISWTAPSNITFVYHVTTVDTAGNLATSNGTSGGVNMSSVTSYRVFRNNTFIGTTVSTAFTDSPSVGVYAYSVTSVSDAGVLSTSNGTATALDTRDTTAPAAATSATATIVANNVTHREVQVSWTASTSSDVSYYRVYRNNTLLGTSSTIVFTDYPNAGIFVYNVNTVDTSGNTATSNGTSGSVSLGELVGSAIIITSPAANANVTTATPVISFAVIDNDNGVGVDITTIAVNVSGFNATRDCTRNNDLNYTCSYTVTGGLTDLANNTITIAAKDKFGNAATNATRNFGVNSQAGVLAALNATDTSAIADNTFANGWSFTFNITLGSTTSNATIVNATAVKIANWTRVGGSETIPTAGNTIMNYTDASGTRRIYYVSHDYNSTDTIYPLQDLDTTTRAINGTVTIFMKIPAATVPGTYSTTLTFGSWSVAMTGGNPT